MLQKLTVGLKNICNVAETIIEIPDGETMRGGNLTYPFPYPPEIQQGHIYTLGHKFYHHCQLNLESAYLHHTLKRLIKHRHTPILRSQTDSRLRCVNRCFITAFSFTPQK